MVRVSETAPSATMSWTEYRAHSVLPAEWSRALSPAEQAVAVHLCEGLSNRQIAAVLCKSPATVKNQVAACLRKLGVPTRTRLIALLR